MSFSQSYLLSISMCLGFHKSKLVDQIGFTMNISLCSLCGGEASGNSLHNCMVLMKLWFAGLQFSMVFELISNLILNTWNCLKFRKINLRH